MLIDSIVGAGAVSCAATVTTKLLVAPRGGEPSSVTRTVIVLVLGPCASVGVHGMWPVAGVMLIPVGWPIILNVSVLVGMSESVAEAETVNAVNSLMI